MSEFLKFEDIRPLIVKVLALENDHSSLLDDLDNVKREIASNFKDFIKYSEQNPKGDEQWSEARLRVLEDKMARIEAFDRDFEKIIKKLEYNNLI